MKEFILACIIFSCLGVLIYFYLKKFDGPDERNSNIRHL